MSDPYPCAMRGRGRAEMEHKSVLRVELSTLGLHGPAQDSTLDGDRPGRAYMSDDRSPKQLRRQAVREPDSGFADWLGRTLHEAYDPVAREPLPPDLAALIHQIDKLPNRIDL